MDFKNKKALVSGVAKSGISAARLLKKLGAEVTIQDAKTEDKLGDVVSELKSEGINLFLGANPDDIVEGMDILVMSPGVPTDLPFVEKAKKALPSLQSKASTSIIMPPQLSSDTGSSRITGSPLHTIIE